jgi:hypothetical protein
MGTGANATWILSGTSAGTFRGGIQLLDAGGAMRLYSGASTYLEVNGNSAGFGGKNYFHSGAIFYRFNKFKIVAKGHFVEHIAGRLYF